MSISAYRIEQSRKERMAMDEADQRKAMEPIRIATEKASRAAGDLIREQARLAALELKVAMTTEPVAFTTAPYSGTGDAASVQAAIESAYEQFKTYVTDEDAHFTARVMAVSFNNPIDSTLLQSWLDLHEWTGQQFVNLEKSFVATPVETPAPTEESATFSDGTPITVLDSETVGNPIFQEACQSICDTSNKPMNGLESKRLYRHFAENSGNGKRYGRLSVASVRRAARDLWSDELVGLTPEEARAKEESRIWESMSASDARKALKIPLETNRAPVVAYPRSK
jgi:hypothetical protein